MNLPTQAEIDALTARMKALADTFGKEAPELKDVRYAYTLLKAGVTAESYQRAIEAVDAAEIEAAPVPRAEAEPPLPEIPATRGRRRCVALNARYWIETDGKSSITLFCWQLSRFGFRKVKLDPPVWKAEKVGYSTSLEDVLNMYLRKRPIEWAAVEDADAKAKDIIELLHEIRGEIRTAIQELTR